jgi:hypothetical protein
MGNACTGDMGEERIWAVPIELTWIKALEEWERMVLT